MSSASALRELAAAFPDRTPEALARVLESHGGRGDLAAATLLAEAIAGEAGDCLLYTSPSPRDLSTSRMPSSA